MKTKSRILVLLVIVLFASGCDTSQSEGSGDGEWNEVAILTASDGALDCYFGKQTDISSDGSVVVVGSEGFDSNRGAVYVYILANDEWDETKLMASDGTADAYYRCAVTISDDGQAIAVGAFGDASNRGAVYV